MFSSKEMLQMLLLLLLLTDPVETYLPECVNRNRDEIVSLFLMLKCQMPNISYTYRDRPWRYGRTHPHTHTLVCQIIFHQPPVLRAQCSWDWGWPTFYSQRGKPVTCRWLGATIMCWLDPLWTKWSVPSSLLVSYSSLSFLFLTSLCAYQFY